MVGCSHTHTVGTDMIIVKEPTCAEEGQGHIFCSECGDIVNTISIPKTDNHTLITIPEVKATCESTGLTEGKKCSVCDKLIVSQYEIPIKAHTYSNNDDDTCNVCGYVRKVDCRHKSVLVIWGKQATCTEVGYTDGQVCNQCGEIIVEQKVIPTLEHSYSTVSVVQPTCAQQGYTLHTCKCGDNYKTDYVDALGHTWMILDHVEKDEWVLAIKGTCTMKSVEYRKCGICQFIEQRETDYYHIFGQWVIVKEATTTEEGLEEGTCQSCGKKVTRTIDKIIKESEGLEYTLNDDGKSYSVTGIGTCTDTDLVIPLKFNELPVTKIGYEAFSNCSQIKSIIIPYGIISIEGFAFYNCTSLSKVIIPNSVTTIWEAAFENCTSLDSITIPNSVTAIYDQAFYNCESLTSIDIPEGVTKIFGNTFAYCKSLEKVTIPQSVRSIDMRAFGDCSALKTINIPNSVLNISSDVFEGCASLQYNKYDNAYYLGNESNPYHALIKAINTDITSCTINNNTKVVLGSAFANCTSMKNINIGNSVTTINNKTFYNCTSLDNVVIPENITYIGMWSFRDCTSLKSISIPDTVTYIEKEAFSGCKSLVYNKYNNLYYLGNENNPYLVLTGTPDDSLTTCKIHENTKLILSGALARFYYLESVTVGEKVTRIGSGAFGWCTALKSITIPDSVTIIDSSAFTSCRSLESIIIPDGVTVIDYCAFQYCKSLKTVTISNSVTSIKSFAFGGCTALERINFEGTIAEWLAIDKHSNWNEDTGADLIIICADGVIVKDGTIFRNAN